jgi:outer membrane protein TolC
MRVQRVRFVVLSFVACAVILAPNICAQNPPPAPPAKIPMPSAQSHGTIRLTLDQAIQMALEHNHNLKAAQTTIQQNQAQEITANLRPNPVLSADTQFLPIFQPDQF